MKSHLYQYRTARPLPNLGARRQGALIRFASDRWIDISPLPGRSQETLMDVLKNMDLSSPSAQWGLMQSEIPLAPEVRVLCNGLIHESDQTQVQEALHLAAKAGFTHVKIKAPRDWIHSWNWSKFNLGSLMIRLDANESYNDPARDLAPLQEIPKTLLDYVEEPFPIHNLEDLEATVAIMEEADLPLALDECLLRLEAHEVAKHFSDEGTRSLSALILKPTLLGKSLTDWIRTAEKLGLRVVVSSTFESPVGFYHLANLAHRISPLGVHGLSLPDWDLKFQMNGPYLDLKWSDVCRWAENAV